MFVDRETELAFLERAWRSQRAEFIVVYGRRRVGKTALLRAFCADHPHTFWMASLNSQAVLRQSLTNALWRTLHPETPEAGFVYEDWERVFQAMADPTSEQRRIVVIDEFPYLVSADPSIPSVLQKVWDERLQHTRLMLILCGSHIGMMEREVLAYRAPLYGRRTGQIQLRPLPLRTAIAFFPRYDPIQQIEAYAVLGGIPAYLTQFDDQESILDNIERRILNSGSYLYLEPQFLLREELREPRNYFAILQAIAQGRTQLNAIAQITGMERGPVSRYLGILRDLRLVERRVPVTEKRPAKSRRGSYQLRDPFLGFWFRFVAPHFSTLERGYTTPIAQLVERELSTFIGPVFENLCRDWVTEQAALGNLPFFPKRIGGWWDGREEIDVVAIGTDGEYDAENAVLLGECKWTSRPIGANILSDLKRKAHPLIRSMGWSSVHFALFARSGFTPTLKALAQDEGVLLVGPEMLLSDSQ